MQPFKPFKLFFNRIFKKFISSLILICLVSLIVGLKANAQKDTTVVDTVSMSHIDSLTQLHNDEFVDTTVKHIYDTSEYFFNRKEDYKQLYTTEKITQRHLIDKEVNEFKSEEDFWYVPAIEKIETRLKTDAAFRDSLFKAANHEVTDVTGNDFRQKTWFRFIVWFVIISVFLGAIIYFLLQNKINLFSAEPASSTQNFNEDEHENIFKLSYNQLLRKAETEQNYRVAVRLMFLQTLKLLSETNTVHYQPDYTNLYYLQQLHQSKFYNEFFKLTRSYEYLWYGKFEISAERYTSIKNDFLILQSKII